MSDTAESYKKHRWRRKPPRQTSPRNWKPTQHKSRSCKQYNIRLQVRGIYVADANMYWLGKLWSTRFSLSKLANETQILKRKAVKGESNEHG